MRRSVVRQSNANAWSKIMTNWAKASMCPVHVVYYIAQHFHSTRSHDNKSHLIGITKYCINFYANDTERLCITKIDDCVRIKSRTCSINYNKSMTMRGHWAHLAASWWFEFHKYGLRIAFRSHANKKSLPVTAIEISDLLLLLFCVPYGLSVRYCRCSEQWKWRFCWISLRQQYKLTIRMHDNIELYKSKRSLSSQWVRRTYRSVKFALSCCHLISIFISFVQQHVQHGRQLLVRFSLDMLRMLPFQLWLLPILRERFKQIPAIKCG